VIVFNSNEFFDKEVISMQMLANGSIDGFMMSLSMGTENKQVFHHIKEVINHDMIIVMIERVIDQVECDKVIIDDYQEAYNAVSYLIESGSKNIAIISMPDYMSVGNLRTQGYRKALQDHGIEVDDNLIIKVEDPYGGSDVIEELLINHTVDAVFGVTEFFAVSAMKIAQKMGKSAPEDISFIGFTDGISSISSSPSLRTVSQGGEEIGEKAADLLIKRLEDPDYENRPFVTEIIKSSLVKRESTL